LFGLLNWLLRVGYPQYNPDTFGFEKETPDGRAPSIVVSIRTPQVGSFADFDPVLMHSKSAGEEFQDFAPAPNISAGGVLLAMKRY
jgi:hypothetical protein